MVQASAKRSYTGDVETRKGGGGGGVMHSYMKRPGMLVVYKSRIPV